MECAWVNTGAGRRPQCACPARRAAASDGEAARVSSTVDWSSVPPNSPAVPVTVPTHAALAPLSGWIVGKWGVPRSIALYFGFVTAALVPTVLLPLRGAHGAITCNWLWASRQRRDGGGMASDSCGTAVAQSDQQPTLCRPNPLNPPQSWDDAAARQPSTRPILHPNQPASTACPPSWLAAALAPCCCPLRSGAVMSWTGGSTTGTPLSWQLSFWGSAGHRQMQQRQRQWAT